MYFIWDYILSYVTIVTYALIAYFLYSIDKKNINVNKCWYYVG